jgi:hypothetical protein
MGALLQDRLTVRRKSEVQTKMELVVVQSRIERERAEYIRIEQVRMKSYCELL